ncbi:conserved hypothetical protein [Altererythrobacter sp. B11]|nr:conserved hypothetical protein [Altererythrobacter sp. B11]
MISLVAISGPAIAQPGPLSEAAANGPLASACEQDANVDSCWRAGVAAERRGDAPGALAAYEASCAAGFQMGGCYEAGKIYFLNKTLRDYRKSRDRMLQVCESDDVGTGPYACKYLGIIYRKGLAGAPDVERAFGSFSRSCFPTTDQPFIDGNGCEIFADTVPSADEMSVPDEVWHPDYIAYLALAMGCSDDMPALCQQASAIHHRALATSAQWLARCAEDAEAVAFAEGCEAVVRSAAPGKFERRQEFRRRVVRMFHRATDYAG